MNEWAELATDPWRTLVEHAEGGFGLSMLDASGVVRLWSPGAAKLTGYAEEDAVGRHASFLFTPEERAQGRPEQVLGIAADKGIHELDCTLDQKGGERRPIHVRLEAVRDPAGTLVGFSWVFTERGLDAGPERLARAEAALAEAEASARWARFLAEASRVLASSLDYEETLASVAQLAVPALADFAVVDLIEEDGSCRRKVSGHVDPAMDARVRRLADLPASWESGTCLAMVLRSGEPLLVSEAGGDSDVFGMALAPGAPELVRELGATSLVSVPIVARGARIGAITFVTTRATGRTYGQAELVRAEDVAARAALAIDNARLARREHAARQAAERESRRASSILESITDAFYAVDGDWRFTYINRKAEEATGMSRGRALGRSLWELAPELLGTEIEQEYRRALDERRAVHFESTYTPSGRCFEMHVYPADDGLAIYARDITDSRRAEAERRKSEQRFRAIFEHGGMGILLVAAADEKILDANPAFEKLSGYGAAELRGMTLAALAVPEDVERYAGTHRELLDGRRESYELELRHVRKDGSTVWVRLWASLLRAEGDKPLAIAMVVDITARKRAEESALRLAWEESSRAQAEAARERVENVLESITDPFFAFDAEGRFTFVNRQAEELLGRRRGEILGRSFAETGIDSLDETRLLSEIERSRATGEEADWEEEIPARRAFFAFHVFPSVEGVSVYLRDVTDRHQAEQAQRRLAEILEATPDFVASADVQGRLHYVNRAGRRMSGLESLEGVALPAVLAPEAAMHVLDHGIPAALRTGVWEGETAIRSPDGSETVVSQVLLAHRDESGTPTSLSTIARDIGERKRAEEAQRFLAEASRRLVAELDYPATMRLLAEISVPALADFCLVSALHEGKLVQVAEAHRDAVELEKLRDLSGVRDLADTPVGPMRVLRTGRSELVPEVTAAWIRAASGNDERFRLASRLDAASLLIVPLVARGRTLGTLTLGTLAGRRPFAEADLVAAEDFAARAALAADNARLYRDSVEATRLREEVLGVVSHDLRNPLSTVALSAQLLLQRLAGPGREADRKQVETIKRSTDRAVRLIGDLLDVAKMEAGRLSLETAPVETGPLVAEAVELHRPLAQEQGVLLELALEAPLPPVQADRDRVLQVFSNLIGNPLKLMREGGRIAVGARSLGDSVEFFVRDDGPGIAAEDLPHIFDRFWQAKGSREGAGLGLAITRSLVEAHGGTIAAESEPGTGATFTFRLPVAPRDS